MKSFNDNFDITVTVYRNYIVIESDNYDYNDCLSIIFNDINTLDISGIKISRSVDMIQINNIHIMDIWRVINFIENIFENYDFYEFANLKIVYGENK